MTDTPRPGIIHVIGTSNTGKTTLIEWLIPCLRRNGLRVGTIKHAHHGFDMDHPGKDSWRHAKAGAEAVGLISNTQAAWLVNVAGTLTLDEMVEPLKGRVDLLLIEGFKQQKDLHILIDPSPTVRLSVDEKSVRVGVEVESLLSDEIEKIAQFCMKASALNV